MTVFEIGGEIDRRRRRAGVPARRAPRRRPDPARLRLPARQRRPRGRADARARGSRRRAAVPDARDRACEEIWATRLTLGLVKSKLDEHGLLRAAELREIDPEGGPIELGPFRLEFVRMAHSVPDAVGIAIETAAGPRLPHRRLEARPHAGRRPAHRRRPARRARQPRRRPAARRLDERRAAGLHALRARRRRGVPPDHPGAARAASSSRASRRTSTGCSRRSTSRVDVRPQGRRRRPLDAQEPEHRAQPRLRRGARRRPRPAGRPRRRAAGRAADPLHRARRASRSRR